MKRLIIFAAISLAGCAAQPNKEQAELVHYLQTVKPLAGTTVKWSDYFEGLYSRDQAAGARGDTLLRVNDAIRLAKKG